MQARILHESRGRIRLRLRHLHMSISEADIFEAYMKTVSGVYEVKVYEYTSDAVIFYSDANDRAAILQAVSAFSFSDQSAAEVSEYCARALQHQYVEKLTIQILRRIIGRFVLPVNLRSVVTAVKSVPYLWRGLQSLAEGKLRVSVLDAASILVCILRGEYDTAGSVMFLLGIGDTMEEWTHKKSVNDLAGAMSLNVDRVWVRTADAQEVLTDISRVKAGDVMIVRTGNMIPLDGEVCEGDAMVNQASITGEPLAVHKRAGGYLYAGSVVEEGELFVTVKETNGSGRYDRIVAMIEESEKLKSEAETRAVHLADRLVPWTFGATALTYLLTRNATRATSILMVDFCCALKLSMPIAVLSAMREAGGYHISVKGGKFLEAFAQAETVVFDKTGTLTIASPRVKEVVPFGGRDEAEMLTLAACLEEHYPHSMANAVVQEAKNRGLEHEEKHTKVEYVVAHGIASSIDGQKVCIGSYHFIFEDEGCKVPAQEQSRFDALPDEYSHLYMALGGELAAVILIEDPLKDEAADVIKSLHSLGFEKVVMMTGDSERTARVVAERVGVDAYYAEVLPEDKAAFIRREHEEGRKVVMIGDGINDSPALSEADAGVAINSGAAIAREIADITISEDDLASLLILRRLSMGLRRRIDTNYRSIIAFNSFLIVMGMLGIFTPTVTALLHNGSTILISLHGMTDILKET